MLVNVVRICVKNMEWELTAGPEAPIRRVQADGRLLECFACAAKRQEAFSIEIGKYCKKNVKREFCYVLDFGHGVFLQST